MEDNHYQNSKYPSISELVPDYVDEDEQNFEPDFESTLSDLDNEPTNPLTQFLESSRNLVANAFKKNRLVNGIILLTLFLFYNAYLITAIAYHVRNETDFAWCEGLGFLVVLTGIVYYFLFYYHVLKKYCSSFFKQNIGKPWSEKLSPLLSLWYVQVGISLVVLAALLTFIIVDTADNRKRLISTLGLVLMVLLGVVLSKHPGRIRWRHVIWGMGLQFVFGLIILRWDTGRNILQCISDKVSTFLDFTMAGSGFVYGYLASGYKFNYTLDNGESLEFELPGVFAFQALSVIYFFSFVVALLYHYGAMTWLVAKMGWLLEISVGTTAAESMNASANIFLGMTEAPLVVKPYISKMTNSELHAVMTGGFATIAGTVLGAYISFGIAPFHLLSASVMSAPAALAFAKILYPETKVSLTNAKEIYNQKPKMVGNALDSASKGASQAVFLVGNIIASLIAITAFVALLNSVINWFGLLVGMEELTFEWLVAKLFTPLAWAIGIDNEEIEDVALLLGLKTVVNEFVAYSQLTEMCLSPRSVTIATYALCCFANFSSIGITLGGLAGLCPERSKDMAKVVFSSFIGGNAAALMTACVAGTLSTDAGYSEWIKTANCTRDPVLESSVLRGFLFSKQEW